MVAGHCKLSMLLFYGEITKVVLLRKLVTEANSIIIYSEPDVHVSVCFRLFEMCHILIVMVAYLADLTPHRFPRLIESTGFGIHNFKTVHQAFAINQFQTKFTVFNHRLSLITYIIDRHSVVELELNTDISAGRFHIVGICHYGCKHKTCGNGSQTFKVVCLHILNTLYNVYVFRYLNSSMVKNTKYDSNHHTVTFV